MASIELGTLGEWAGAIFAAVPLIFWAVERSERLKTQAKLDKREQFEEDERLVYQAARTAFWKERGPVYAIRNHSDLPLRSASLFIRRPASDDGKSFGRLPVDDWDVIPPMETVKTALTRSLELDDILVMEFTDSRGTTWQRWQSGELKRIWTVEPNTAPAEGAGG